MLLQRIGAGGMGEVFRGRHRVLEREDAVKRILPGKLDSAGMVARFLREAKAAARLRHPNVVHVYDAGESSGAHYLAMELLAGEDLANHLHRRGPLPIAEAVEFVRQACVGMQHAHERGLVHRDLKPANLMLCEGRVVKIMDLGLALVSGASRLTRLGGKLGSVDYEAPEQVKDPHAVDIRADVYSLGCTLYHLLTGQTPFDEAHPDARPMMHLDREPRPVEERRPEVPVCVAEVVRRMMAKKPQERYQTPGSAAEALQSLLTGKNQTAPPPTRELTLPAVTKVLVTREDSSAPDKQMARRHTNPPSQVPARPSTGDKPTIPSSALRSSAPRPNHTPTEESPRKRRRSAKATESGRTLLMAGLAAALALALVCVGLLVVPPLLSDGRQHRPKVAEARKEQPKKAEEKGTRDETNKKKVEDDKKLDKEARKVERPSNDRDGGLGRVPPSLTGTWQEGTLDPKQGAIRISVVQRGEEFTADCSYRLDKYGEVRWRMTGTVTKDGKINGLLEHTKAPQWYKKHQTRTASISVDGATIKGRATFDGGQHDFVWTKLEK